ncbi:Urea carboxylase-related ABC transporter,periplasmic substrate-binding protein [Pseudoalteromonas luteoviolacea B = ATCC 29581]|nr:Urea carboxylase-related ABC transporter,periplasmic substrate-binding protein [Pseudoalteromonas luteoviolacea B = ATCC 29581]
MNPWPGYELLYLAKERGYFEQVGLNVELVRVGSLAETQRAYLRGSVDALASTLIEAIQIQAFNTRPIEISLVADYSNGGDVILTSTEITSLQQLKGAKIGCEVSSLGIYLLARGLALNGMTLNDITLVNTEQHVGSAWLKSGKIDAFVTYPPVSTVLLEDTMYHKIFSSRDIPKEVVDVISISKAFIKQNPDAREKLWQAWQLAYEELAKNPTESIQFMAEKEGLTAKQFQNALNDLELIPGDKQKSYFNQKDFQQTILQVCETLLTVASIDTPCAELPALITLAAEGI